MILVDSSIWIDHIRSENPLLTALLLDGKIVVHPFIFGELALGQFRNRAAILREIKDLAFITPASPEEVLTFIERHALYGQGIGYVDTHLLAACKLTPGTSLWTLDKRLAAIAAELGVGANPKH